MKNRKLLLIVSLVLALTMSLGGTLAYLTDVDSDVNVMTLGNVDITQFENGEDGPIDEVDLYPAYIVGNTINGLVEKEVTVKNVGPSDAYVRTVFALEAGECTSYAELEEVVNIRFNDAVTVSWPIKDTVVTIDDGKYFIACVTYDEALAKDETTAASLLDLYMEPTAENDDVKQFGDKYKVLVVSQACQTVNMPTDPAEALNVAFGEITAENNPWIGEDATNKTETVKSDAELLAAIQDANVTSIFVDGELTYDWGGDSYANSKALLLAGKTITGVDADSSITFAGYGSANPITNVTLRNITVKDETKGDDEKAWEHGHLEFTSLKAENVVFEDSIMLDGDSVLENCKMDNTTPSWYGVWVEGGTTTIKTCTFTGTRAIKIHEAYGSDVASVVVDGCSFNLSEKPGVVIGDLNAGTAVTIKNSEFINCQAGDQNLYIYETDTDVTTFTFVDENNTVDNFEVRNVSNAGELVSAFATIKAGDHIVLNADIDMTGKTLEATHGNVGFTLQGNGHTISNLNGTEQGLFVNNTGSADYYFYNVNLKNCQVESSSEYAGLFVGDADTCDELVIEGCTVTDCTVKSAKYAAAFVAYTAGYHVQNNGPVYSDVTIKDCKMIGGSITGGGSTAVAVGHAGGNVDTTTTITNLQVNNVAINGEDAEHTGIAVGTAHIGKTIISKVSYSDVTGNYNMTTNLYGRFVPGSTGVLTIDGVAKN